MRVLPAGLSNRARWSIAIAGGAFGIASLVGYALVSPLRDSPVGYDSAVSVIYFQRLIHGVLLEQPIGATPKPLATLVDGLLFSAFGWRAISLVAVASYAGVVAFGTLLARRVASAGGAVDGAGGAVAAGFAFITFLGSAPLLLDASQAYAVAWAALGCLAAGFAVTAGRPRYAVAGIALGLATLARLETIVVVVGALAILGAARLLVPVTGVRPPRGAWWLALGLLAIPVMLLHDQVLAGDPLYWAHVSERFSQVHPDAVMDPAATLAWLGRHVAPIALTVGLALVGGVVLAKRRSWAVGAGFALLSLGVPALLLLLAARSTYISLRYLALADLAIVIPAAIGVAAISLPELASRTSQAAHAAQPAIARLGRRALAPGLAVLLGLAVCHPFAPSDGATRRAVFDARAVARHVETIVPILRNALATAGPVPAPRPRILAPGASSPRLVIDLGLRIPDVQSALVAEGGLSFVPDAFVAGQLIYHDRIGDAGATVFSALESTGTVEVDGFRFTTIASDPAAGWWVLRVEAGP